MNKISVILTLFVLLSCGTTRTVTYRKKARNIATKVEVKVVASKEALKAVEKVVRKTKKSSKTYLSDATLAYIKKFAPLAMEEMRKFKIPASITIAQGILESGSGKSNLANKSNNHFGIKCHAGWQGERVYHDDDAKGECFRKYEYVATSYQDHSLFLSTRNRYASLFDLKEDDYEAWAKGLKKAGYATDPKYPKKLISYIEKYKLYTYDKMVLKGRNIKYVDALKKTKKKASVAAKKVKKINRRGVHVLKADDTLYSVSQRYGISIEELKRLNNLTDHVIHEGEELKLKPIAKRGQYHIVKKKETLYSISRKYNLTIEELRELNDLKTNDLAIGLALKIK
ncbi:MAG: glucosaminidase domain-containing protein [Wenyingzhuangia sp.]|jgi:flagellum-specific peptidoglycan hydrolase FlgJ|uniref:glucosaminidase domain-containing protein n=1 Tax=Wenyingzhuangia sp. TaxID=1964193 RepID=UPI003219A486